MVRPLLITVLATLSTAAADDQALPIKASLDTAQAMYRSQVLGDFDHRVTDTMTIAGVSITTRMTDTGDLEVDSQGTGRFKKYAKAATFTIEVPVTASATTRAKTVRLSIHVSKREDGWYYRNASQITLIVGKDAYAIVDVNGNGAFNEAGIDGMCQAGQTWLFPLPTSAERFCSETLDCAGLTLGPLGESVALVGRPLATTVPAALPVLIDTNRERGKLGLTPRPEDPELSAALQKHCAYMAINNTLTHPEDAGKPGYTKEGHDAGMRSILSMGTPAQNVARMMVETYFHRQDVIRPETLAFGVGYEGRYGGIDGRTRMAKTTAYRWPILCPVPDQREITLRYTKESPDATPGDERAGYPITAYFGSGKPVLKRWELISAKNPGQPIDCYPFDHQQGASPDFSGFQHVIAIIPREPLEAATWYQVTLEAEHAGKPWSQTWQFATIGAK